MPLNSNQPTGKFYILFLICRFRLIHSGRVGQWLASGRAVVWRPTLLKIFATISKSSLQLTVVCTVETRAIQLFIKASQNFREIHYHFSVPASRQLIQAIVEVHCVHNFEQPLLLWDVIAGLRVGPGRSWLRAVPGRKMAWKLWPGRKFSARAHL